MNASCHFWPLAEMLLPFGTQIFLGISMTTGKRDENYQVKTYTGCGYSNIGTRKYESWSGADSPDPEHRTENAFSKSWLSENKPLIDWYYVSASGDWRFGGSGSYAQCGFGGLSMPPWPFTASDDLYLQNKILSKVKGSDVNFLVSAAEGKESLSMLKNATVSVYKSYRALRKGRITESYRALRDGNLANGRKLPRRLPKGAYNKDADKAWLAIRYGWLPLLNDVYNVCDFIEERAKKRESQFQTFRASRTVTLTSNLGEGPMPSSQQTCTFRYAVRAKVNVKWLSSFQTLQATGVLDPELVAWELMPYSFVVDWFLPIGTWLEVRSALPRLGATYIFTKKTSGEWGGLKSSTQKPGYRLTDKGSSYTSGSFSRTVSTSWGVPLPRFRNPLKGPWKHAIDALALWRSANK